MDNQLLKNIIEAALLAAARPMSIKELVALFPMRQRPEKAQVREAIKSLQENYENRGIELIEVASGFRIQVRPSMIDWLTKLWEERPPRYSRALMETLALVAYRQPITRGDIENVRGVAVSTNIMRTLLERGWVKIVGHRDVPGKPALYGTTPLFLDYFGLKKLNDLPPLAEIKDLDAVVPQLELGTLEPGASLRVVVSEVADEQQVVGTDDEAQDEEGAAAGDIVSELSEEDETAEVDDAPQDVTGIGSDDNDDEQDSIASEETVTSESR
ncbi:MAG: SMC-Scp complex subunit ScpB [Gammaproteobacteria bacterium]|nr:SMC-Scp complex subunit ScpB [Gammaproteobacteria bacterium]NND60282.1 SMC-Scp complex subunit ScpB [Gammaproteobacteria bacterium]